jgi:hypothetical protein
MQRGDTYSGLSDMFGQLSVTAPTTQQVERSLRTAGMPMRHAYGDPWIHCRLDPFTSTGGVQKPDGLGGNRSIIVDHLVADIITCRTGNGFTVQFLPGILPFTGLITGNSAAGAPDIFVNGAPFINPFPGAAINMAPIGVVTEWASSVAGQQYWTAGSAPGQDPYRSAAARVLSVKRKLIYTGTLTGNAGFINVSPSPYDVSKNIAYVTSTASTGAAANTIALVRTDLTQTTTGGSLLQTPMALVDIEIPVVPLFNKDTVAYRVEVGCEITSKQNGSIHQMVPVPDMGAMLVANVSGIAPNAGVTYNTMVCDLNAGGSSPMAAWVIDNSWQGELMNVTGVTSGATFRIETAVCVEYSVQSGSPMAPMGMKPVAPRLKAVERAHALVNAKPVAVPGSISYLNPNVM